MSCPHSAWEKSIFQLHGVSPSIFSFQDFQLHFRANAAQASLALGAQFWNDPGAFFWPQDVFSFYLLRPSRRFSGYRDFSRKIVFRNSQASYERRYMKTDDGSMEGRVDFQWSRALAFSLIFCGTSPTLQHRDWSRWMTQGPLRASLDHEFENRDVSHLSIFWVLTKSIRRYVARRRFEFEQHGYIK